MNTSLNDYIIKAREKNLSNEQIREQLSEIGWPTESIVEAFAYAADLPIPPAPLGKGPVIWWMGLCYLLFFLSLSLLAVGIGGILHNWVDNSHLMPVANNLGATPSPYDFIADYFQLSVVQLIQIYLPAIIIAYVVSLLLVLFLRKQEIKHPTIKESKLYKIATFTTLAVTFIVTISEFITAGYAYLAGDLGFTTFRHLLVVVLSSGVIFAYFFTEITHFGEIKKDLLAFLYITVFTVLASLYGFSLIPSVITERGITFDHKRIIDLGTLQASIDDYYTTNGSLPQSLSTVTPNTSVSTTPLVKLDPQTQQPYEYTITSPTDYKLCANFSTDSSKDDPNGYDNANFDYSSYKDQFTHHAGHQCFDKNEYDSSNTYDNGNSPDFSCVGDGCPQTVPTTAPDTQTSPNQGPSPLTPTPYPLKGGSAGGAL